MNVTIDRRDVARRILAMGGLTWAARARAFGMGRLTLDSVVLGIASEATYHQLLPRLQALEAAYLELVPSDGNAPIEGDLDAYREQLREKRRAAGARRATTKELFNARVCATLDTHTRRGNST